MMKATARQGLLRRRSSSKKRHSDIRDEKALIRRLRNGDQDALRLMMGRYHDRLFSVANRICNNPADAEEILQDVYMVAVNKADRFEGRSSLLTWLYRIAVNTALMKLRSQRGSRHMMPMEGCTDLLGAEENVLRFDREVRPPDETLLAKELQLQIADFVCALPEIYRSVFLLRDVQGYSIEETSRMLNATPSAIKSRLHRTRFFLKEKLEQYNAPN